MHYENNYKHNGMSNQNREDKAGAKFDYRPGDAVGGGYFAGLFTLEGEVYGLVVSSLRLGEFNNVEWGNYRVYVDSSSYIDGLANTVAMAKAGSNTAKEILQVQINVFSDWYIPARDELELIYRNLKPTNDLNLTSFRDGENPSSAPPGYPYTMVEPTQTEVNTFQLAGDQAMGAAWYWSSTQSSVYAAWTQSFKDGSQRVNHKVGTASVRAVRKFRALAGGS